MTEQMQITQELIELPNHSKKVCVQRLFFSGKHLQALQLCFRQKYCNNVCAKKNCVLSSITEEILRT